MKSIRGIVFFLLLVTVVAAGALFLIGAGDGKPFLPGVNVKDDNPNGCVDCHRDAGGGQDYRLNKSLAEQGHVNIEAIVKKIPKDCAMCHRAGAAAGSIQLIIHKAHYQNPEENHFVTNYQGACLSCHTLNSDTGVMGMKSGPKNW